MSEICREFGCTPREALLQPKALVNEIMLERAFVRVYEKSQNAKLDMTDADWAFLEWADGIVNQQGPM